MSSFLFLFMKSLLGAELFSVPEMNCKPCEAKIREYLSSQGQVHLIESSYEEQWVCVDGSYDTEQFKETMRKQGYTFVLKEEQCPVELKEIWADFELEVKENPELDFKIVSRGERFKMRKELQKGKYTLFDFGADWCGFCRLTSKNIQGLLKTRDDFAVRVIHLPGDESASFAYPVVFQHMYDAPGLPWFVLYGPDKKKIYEGNAYEEVERLLNGGGQ
ncbi:MAG: hypothetical protein CMK59_07310 [Proteobacteria bacterium]|nr:hypothetical protein [Pseudomonadota bacterium]